MFFKDLRRMGFLAMRTSLKSNCALFPSAQAKFFSSQTGSLNSSQMSEGRDESKGMTQEFNMDPAVETLRNVYRQKYNLQMIESESKNQYFIPSENFIIQCQEQGLSLKEASLLFRYFKILELKFPESLKEFNLKSILAEKIQFSNGNKRIYLESLRNELNSLEKIMNPLKAQSNALKVTSENFVEFAYRLGISASVSACFIIYGSIYHFYGILILDPTIFLLSTGTFAACGIIFDKSFIGMQIKQYIFRTKLKQVQLSQALCLETLLKLQQEIENIRSELIDLN